MPSNFLLIGPLTKDLIIENNNERSSVGGAVFYQSFIFESFNPNYTILTTLGENDIELLNDFPNKYKIQPIFKKETLTFKNNYSDENPNHRKQSSNFVNNPILKKDFKNLLDDNFDSFVLNPLISTDIPIKTIEYLKNFNIPIYLSLQGYLRNDIGGNIELSHFNNLEELLFNIDTVFLDINEAKILFNNKLNIQEILNKIADYGPNEVIITCADKGSIIFSKESNEYFKIPAYIPKIVKNPTGAGDTYMASYLIKRSRSLNIGECGKFAAMTSSIKISELNHFNKSNNYVLKKINKKN